MTDKQIVTWYNIQIQLEVYFKIQNKIFFFQNIKCIKVFDLIVLVLLFNNTKKLIRIDKFKP